MRDPVRMEPLVTELLELWKTMPDSRLLQTLALMVLPGEDPFYLEDDVLRARIAIMSQQNGTWQDRQLRMLMCGERFRAKNLRDKQDEITDFIIRQRCYKDRTDAMMWCKKHVPNWESL